MASLDDFLEARAVAAAAPVCLLMAADWVLACTGVDPAADLRERCATATGRRSILRQANGVRALMEARATAVGLEPTDTPQRGDVGLVRLPSRQVVAAICTGRLWAVTSSRGLFASTATVLRAWRVDG